MKLLMTRCLAFLVLLLCIGMPALSAAADSFESAKAKIRAAPAQWDHYSNLLSISEANHLFDEAVAFLKGV